MLQTTDREGLTVRCPDLRLIRLATCKAFQLLEACIQLCPQKAFSLLPVICLCLTCTTGCPLIPVCMQVLNNDQGSFMFRWWGPKDNKALLWHYWKRGFNLSGSRRATSALHAFAEWLIHHHSTRRFDLTVNVSTVLGIEHSWTWWQCHNVILHHVPTVCIASCSCLIHVDHPMSLHSSLCTRSATR